MSSPIVARPPPMNMSNSPPTNRVGTPPGIFKVAPRDQLEFLLEHEKIAIYDVIQEYIASDGDMAEAVELLENRKEIEGSVFIEQSIQFGLEHAAAERELISRLLPEAHRVFDEGKGFDDGFQAILFALPELVLDNPDSEEHVGLFIARAIYDDALPPSFLKTAEVDNDLANRAVALAYNLTNNLAEKSRLENVWGRSEFLAVDELREEVDMILKEYLGAASVSETMESLRALKSPSFMSQVVKQTLYLALDNNKEETSNQLLELLSACRTAGLFGDLLTRTGFELALSGLKEVLPDLPKNAPEALTSLVTKAKALKILNEDSL
eukprot:TRINITY_DN16_c0_g1_i1.p1 TRINITY_DN16_c0_g1~~TRINITY_DN16_c0_g1_i1.p1  ORF type:complete len:324 (-),score=115.55 TRINITY_DN16_c0_g1_i1:271-1242(-)